MGTLKTVIQNGKRFVMVPESKYDAMREQLEDAADIAALDYALSLNQEGFPLSLFDAIDAGENPVRAFRKYRGLTQQQLADAAGILRPMLSSIENGQKSGSIATAKAIAKALKVPLEEIV